MPPGPPLAPLSPWLRLMLAEIERKQEERERAQAEESQRSSEREQATRDASAPR